MRLTIAHSPNPRIQPLINGEVTIPGVELDWTFGHPANLHEQHLKENRFDVFEFSLSNYLIVQDNLATARVHWKAIPIFLSKANMWLRLCVKENAGINHLRDVRGKRFGIPDFHMTAAIWMRIVLRQLYDIGPGDVAWINGRTIEHTHGDDVGKSLAKNISLSRLTSVGELDRLLHAGEIDVAYGDGNTAAVTSGNGVRPLFSGRQGPEVIEAYVEKTGHWPVNHVLMAQERLLKDDPTLALRLYDGFERSKQLAYEKAREVAGGYLVFGEEDVARQQALCGDDAFPSGLAANRAMLTMLLNQEVEEGLVTGPLRLDSIFAAETLNT